MIKKIFLFVGILIYSNCAFGQGLEITFDYYEFPSEDSRSSEIMTVVSLPANQLKYKDHESIFASGLEVSFRAKKIGGGVYSFTDTSIFVVQDTTRLNYLFNAVNVLEMESGNYDWNLQVIQGQDSINGEGQLLIRDHKETSLSSMVFIEKAIATKKDLPDVRQGYQLAIINDYFFPPSRNKISAYMELRTHDSLMGKTLFVNTYLQDNHGNKLEQNTQAKTIESKVTPLFQMVSLRKMVSGQYTFHTNILSPSMKVLASRQRDVVVANKKADQLAKEIKEDAFMEELNSLEEKYFKTLVASHQVVAELGEQSSIEYMVRQLEKEEQADSATRAGIANYLLQFWSKRDQVNPRKQLVDFRAKVDQAQKLYAMGNFPAYKTDRGRVFIKYGAPNQIFDQNTDLFRRKSSQNKTRPYEIWSYWYFESTGQSNIEFVFVEGDLGGGYRMLHSNAIGEYRNDEWRKVVNRVENNLDYTDPNDRQDADQAAPW